MFELRPEQKEVLDFVMASKLNNVALLCPTAFGKGHIAKAISEAFKGKRVVIITYSNALVRQFTQAFPLPFFIGAKHYSSQAAYQAAMNNAKYCPVVLMNPASYMRYKAKNLPPFDVAIIDEADSCIGVFELQTGKTFAYGHEYVTEHIAAKVISPINAQLAESVRLHPGKHWLQVELGKIHGKVANTLVVRDLYLTGFRKMLPEKTILMSGTLFPSHVGQLLSGEEYDYYESPSPIPPERRPIHAFTEDVFNGTTEGLGDMIRAVLGYFTDRPAVLHCSYADSVALSNSTEFSGYLNKEDKLMAFAELHGTQGALLAAGATTGLDLVGDACRLNVILRGAFQSLGSDLVQKRLCMPGGAVWYKEEVLRQCIQAVGRACRTPTDFGRSVITDVRVVTMLSQEAHNLPKYFTEALEFLSWKEYS